MIRLYLLIALIAIGFGLGRKLLAGRFSLRPLYSKAALKVIVGILLTALALTGHLAWLTAAIGVLMAFLVRNLPWIVRYAPQLHRFWQSFRATKQQQSSAGYGASSRQGKMTVAEAYKILGLKPPAAKQEIILAHKKLMQKVHPDRGGSDYLASQINLAKDLLLKN